MFDILLSFLEACLKRNQGKDLYITFSFFIYPFAKCLQRDAQQLLTFNHVLFELR